MGRPSKGSGARSEVFSIRVTPQEVGALTARFGSVAKGVRHLLDAWLPTEPVRKRPVVKGSRKAGDASAPLMHPAYTTDEMNAQIRVEPVPFEAVDPDTLPGHDIILENGTMTEVFVGTSIPVHRHRRGALIRVDFDRGQPKNVYACVECKEELG